MLYAFDGAHFFYFQSVIYHEMSSDSVTEGHASSIMIALITLCQHD